MKRVKSWLFAIVAAAGALSIAVAPVAGARTLEEITASKKLIVGVNPTLPPLGIFNAKNEIDGFDVDIAREIASKMGLQLEIVQVGSPDASNVTFEVSNQADLRVTGEDAILFVGAGAGAVTTTNVQTGGSVVSDLFITGAESTSGSASSTNTINIAGVGSSITTTEAFDTNGGYRYSSNRRGSTTNCS